MSSRKPAWLMKPKYDLSKIVKDLYYIVDLRVIHRPQVIRLEFKSFKLANKWLKSRSLKVNQMQFSIEVGKTILEYEIPYTTYYQNAGDRTKKLISLLYRESGDNRGNNKYGSKVIEKNRFR